MSDKSSNKRVSAVLVAAYLLTEVMCLSSILESRDERPRHKGGRRRKKTWMEKQQRKRGWKE